jgi:hypothetical protein
LSSDSESSRTKERKLISDKQAARGGNRLRGYSGGEGIAE